MYRLLFIALHKLCKQLSNQRIRSQSNERFKFHLSQIVKKP